MKKNYIVNTKCKKCGSPKQNLLLKGSKNECPFCKQNDVFFEVDLPPQTFEVDLPPQTMEKKEEKTEKRPLIWDTKMSKTRLLEILIKAGYKDDVESLSKKEIIKILKFVYSS